MAVVAYQDGHLSLALVEAQMMDKEGLQLQFRLLEEAAVAAAAVVVVRRVVRNLAEEEVGIEQVAEPLAAAVVVVVVSKAVRNLPAEEEEVGSEQVAEPLAVPSLQKMEMIADLMDALGDLEVPAEAEGQEKLAGMGVDQEGLAGKEGEGRA